MNDIHTCLHEADIARMVEKVDTMKDMCEKIYVSLHGNGKEGLVTTVAVNGFWLKLAWGLIGIQTTALFGIAFFIIKNGILKI